jgi:sulfonate transport system ATP-binding protein
MAADLRELNACPTVRVRDLVRGFSGRGVLNGLDLDIQRGEFVALLGRSGSGKSTLLRALATFDHGVTGSGEMAVPDNVAVVFQDARLLPWKRAIDNVTLGLEGPNVKTRALQALAEVELAGRELAWPNQLSGGEQQRVALARSLVRAPELLLADEPFSALDALTRLRMHDLLRRLCQRHRPAVLLVTHDVEEAIKLADRIVVLEAGKLVTDIVIDPQTRNGTGRRALRATLLAQMGVYASPEDALAAI